MKMVTEAVGAGHPDKICDQIADNILDKFLQNNPKAKVACEVFAVHNQIYIAGEVSTTSYIDVVKAAWDILHKYGYTELDFTITSSIHEQSIEINNIVHNKKDEIGAGDQGIMFGYATNETKSLMPLSYVLAQEILKNIESFRIAKKLKWVKPDMKSQIIVEYKDNKINLESILLSIQHSKDYKYDEFRASIISKIINPLIKKYNLNNDFAFRLNHNGTFILGGPKADSGLTGRKIIVDNYGPTVHNGGGSFSGKDYTKVDRTGAYIARWIAKNIVVANLADKCEVKIAYEIGESEPILLELDTFNTNKIPEKEILKKVRKYFNLKLSYIIDHFNMRTIKYLPLATYGHFGRDEFNYKWENTDLAKQLKEVNRG